MIVHNFIMRGRYVRLLLPTGRRPFAYHPDSREFIEPLSLQYSGEMIAEPPGPLGPRPVVLGYRLVQCWLPEEEWSRWRKAGVIPAGQRAMIERIEKEILELEARPDFRDLLVGPDLGDEPPTPTEGDDDFDLEKLTATGLLAPPGFDEQPNGLRLHGVLDPDGNEPHFGIPAGQFFVCPQIEAEPGWRDYLRRLDRHRLSCFYRLVNAGVVFESLPPLLRRWWAQRY